MNENKNGTMNGTENAVDVINALINKIWTLRVVYKKHPEMISPLEGMIITHIGEYLESMNQLLKEAKEPDSYFTESEVIRLYGMGAGLGLIILTDILDGIPDSMKKEVEA